MENKANDRKAQAKRIDEEFEKTISKYNVSAKKIMPVVVISVIVDMMGYMPSGAAVAVLCAVFWGIRFYDRHRDGT